jgi:putative aldouronate transport system substrate-binding protein
LKRIILIIIVLTSLAIFGCTKKGASVNDMRVTEITVMAPSMGPVPSGAPEVEAAVNAISEREIGVRIKLIFLDVGSYSDQMGLSMSSQEKIDLLLTLPAGPAGFAMMTSQNQLMDIGDLVNQYGQDLVKATDEVMSGFADALRVNGKLLGISGFYDKALMSHYAARKDLLDKHGISIENITNLDDITAVLAKFKEAEPAMSGILPMDVDGAVMDSAGGLCLINFDKPVPIDLMGETRVKAAVAFLNKDPYTVVNWYNSDEFKTLLSYARKWYLAGYVYKDSTINNEMPEELVKSNKGITWFTGSEIGVEANKSAQTGYPIRAKELAVTPLSTNSLNKFVWAIPSYSKEGAAAMKFMNLMYTNAEISNLLTFGIEGRDYVGKDDGTIGYPDGVTAQTVPYHMAEFLFGNQFMLKVWEGNPPDLRQQALAKNRAMQVSPLLGFTMDTTPVQNELMSMSNVFVQYYGALTSGSVDPGENLPIFLKALDEAGVERFIAEAQRQLDAWRKEN